MLEGLPEWITLVSIHVPARGTTTFPEFVPLDDYVVSIHVPARGTTTLEMVQAAVDMMFQSTFPHGERRRLVT